MKEKLELDLLYYHFDISNSEYLESFSYGVYEASWFFLNFILWLEGSHIIPFVLWIVFMHSLMYMIWKVWYKKTNYSKLTQIWIYFYWIFYTMIPVIWYFGFLRIALTNKLSYLNLIFLSLVGTGVKILLYVIIFYCTIIVQFILAEIFSSRLYTPEMVLESQKMVLFGQIFSSLLALFCVYYIFQKYKLKIKKEAKK